MFTGISGSKHVRRASMTCASIIAAFMFVMSMGPPAVIRARSPHPDPMPNGLLRRNLLLFPLQRGMQGVPRQGSALDPNREFAHAGKGCELSQFTRLEGRVRLAGEHFMEGVEKGLRFGLGLPFDAGGHQRGRGLGNGAARP